VLERLEASGGTLPVVSRSDAHRLEGIITPENLMSRHRLKRGSTQPPL